MVAGVDVGAKTFQKDLGSEMQWELGYTQILNFFVHGPIKLHAAPGGFVLCFMSCRVKCVPFEQHGPWVSEEPVSAAVSDLSLRVTSGGEAEYLGLNGGSIDVDCLIPSMQCKTKGDGGF